MLIYVLSSGASAVSLLMIFVSDYLVSVGERPYKCPQCEKTFAQRSNLMTHITLHSGMMNEI